MPKKPAKRTPSPDPNVAALDAVRRLTEHEAVVVGHIEATDDSEPAPTEGKNPAAVALGRLGGLKGGKARAASLSKEKRSEIARNAAAKRWKKNGGH